MDRTVPRHGAPLADGPSRGAGLATWVPRRPDTLPVTYRLLNGNERLAWSAVVTFLALDGVSVIDIDVDAVKALILAVTSGELREVHAIEPKLKALYGR